MLQVSYFCWHYLYYVGNKHSCSSGISYRIPVVPQLYKWLFKFLIACQSIHAQKWCINLSFPNHNVRSLNWDQNGSWLVWKNDLAFQQSLIKEVEKKVYSCFSFLAANLPTAFVLKFFRLLQWNWSFILRTSLASHQTAALLIIKFHVRKTE